jgi:hypothetical protein
MSGNNIRSFYMESCLIAYPVPISREKKRGQNQRRKEHVVKNTGFHVAYERPHHVALLACAFQRFSKEIFSVLEWRLEMKTRGDTII